MPVNTEHPDWTANAPLWKKCRDASEGQEAVHAAGKEYLPVLSEQNGTEYAAYLARTLYFNATGRTLDGMTGMMFRRPPENEVPAAVSYLLDDVDTAGTPLIAFEEKAVEELVKQGRFALLADFPPVQPGATLADAQSIGARPLAKLYCAEYIINWRTTRVANRTMLSLVVLVETHEDDSDPFVTIKIPQWRILRLVDGSYTVEIWRLLDAKAEPVLIDSYVPLMGNSPMAFIPIVIAGPMGSGAEVQKPPLLALANVNLSHYRSTADYEHGLHFTGLPTPYVTGHTFEPGQKFALGSTEVKAFPNEAAKPGFMEFAGTGLGALSTRLSEKEQMMVALGARMLANPTRGIESAETAQIHRAGENSVLASISNSASSALSQVLTWCAMWAGVQEPVKVRLNTDFMPAGMTAQELQALVAAWQSSAISFDTLHDNLSRGEISTRTAEEERDLIDAEGPPLGALTEPGLQPEDNAKGE
jgi:hypothetical protein